MIQGAGCSWGEWITWFPTWLRCPRKCRILWLDCYPRDAGSGYGGHGRGRESPWPFPSWFLMTWMVVWLYLPSLSATIVLPGLFCSSWLFPPGKAQGCLLRVGSERRRCRRLFPLSVPTQQIRWLWCWEVLGGVTGIFLLFHSKYGSCKLQGVLGAEGILHLLQSACHIYQCLQSWYTVVSTFQPQSTIFSTMTFKEIRTGRVSGSWLWAWSSAVNWALWYQWVLWADRLGKRPQPGVSLFSPEAVLWLGHSLQDGTDSGHADKACLLLISFIYSFHKQLLITCTMPDTLKWIE